MQFRILGSLQLRLNGNVFLLAGQREQRIVATLLLAANRAVALSQLTEAVWDDNPPATAKRQLQNAVSALRRRLLGAGATADLMVADGPGYRITLTSGQLDARTFETRYSAARRHSTVDRKAAAELIRSALRLWRGPALADITGRIIEAGAARLNEQRLCAVEECVDLELALGRHRSLVGELAELHAEHPNRERIVGQLMLALYRSGRQAEALQVFHGLRVRLADELGVDPSPSLRQLHTAILREDPAVGSPGPSESPGPPISPISPASTTSTAQATSPKSIGHLGAVGKAAEAAPAAPDRPLNEPRQLPAALPHFAGRSAELAALHRLARRSGPAGAATLVVISGTAGVGKTALAVYWAHQVRAAFPDGQLYVDLRGFHSCEQAMEPAEAIRGFLEAIDVRAQGIPAGLDAQAARYRSLLAGRRMLIVLDNARDSAQVRPLLPGAPGCLVVVTSRDQLTGLVATEAAHPISLDLPSVSEAGALLARRLGVDRTAAEPGALMEIISQCARLPLALAIVAGRAAIHRHFPLTILAAELRDSHNRLDALAGGDDPASDVRAMFSWSYRTLTRGAARLFRLLGLHPGPDISAAAAASLANLPVLRTRPLLAELTRANLIIERSPGRYGFHNLLRAYAIEQTRTIDTGPQRRAATERMLDHYLHTAYTASQMLDPLREVMTPPIRNYHASPEPIADHSQAVAWFTREHAVIMAIASQAARSGWDTQVVQLACALVNHLDWAGRWHDLAVIARAAISAAERLDNASAQAVAHGLLARAYTRLDRRADTLRHLLRALELATEAGDRLVQARIHNRLSCIVGEQGHRAKAVEHEWRALALYQEADNRYGLATTLNAVGWRQAQLGDSEPAIEHCQRSLALFQELDNKYGQARAWDGLGYAHYRRGEHTEALACYEHALRFTEDLGDHYGVADILIHIGDAHDVGDDTEAARAAYLRALTILDQLDHPRAQRVRARLAELDDPQLEFGTGC